jgi:uncharacterized YkwD family protein
MRKLFFAPLVTAVLIGLLAIPTMAYSSIVKITPDMFKTYSPASPTSPTTQQTINNPTVVRWSNVVSLKGLLNSYSVPITKTPTPNPVQTPVPTPTPMPTPTPTPVTPVPTTSPDGQLSLTQDEQLIVNLVNQERVKAGLKPLQVDYKLVKVARLKAKDMVDNHYFSHTSPTYGSPFDMMKSEGVSYRYAGENIAGNSTASGAMTAWMQSEGHRTNILNPNFTHIGVGVGYQASPYNIYVQEFAQEG